MKEDKAEGRVYEHDAHALGNALTKMDDCIFSVYKTGHDFKSGDKIEVFEPVRITFTVIGMEYIQ